MSAKDSIMFHEAVERKISGILTNEIREFRRNAELE